MAWPFFNPKINLLCRIGVIGASILSGTLIFSSRSTRSIYASILRQEQSEVK